MQETYFLNKIVPLSLGGFCCIIICYFFLDIPVAQYFKYVNQTIYRISQDATRTIDPKYHYLIWPCLLFLTYFFSKKNIAIYRYPLFLLVMSVPVTNCAIEILKRLLGRARPELLLEHQIYGFSFFATSNSYFSFPSGHACTAGAIFGSLCCFFPRLTLLFFVFSIIVSFTRVVLNEHFVSDIIAGVLMGFFISQFIYSRIYTNKLKKRVLTTSDSH